MTNAELLDFLFDQPTADATEILTSWILQSRRFQSFMVEYRAKIRKKLRAATTPESLNSLLLELDIARYFSQDRHCKVEYEKFGQGKGRGPDLTVTYRTHTLFNLEATCVQMAQGQAEGQAEKLADIVGHKLGQLIPETLNLLVLSLANASIAPQEVNTAMKALKLRVEQRDTQLLSRFGFNDPMRFFKQFQWLNGIVLWQQTQPPPTLAWTNPQARRSLPDGIGCVLRSG